MTERPDRNLAMELVRVTEAAALAAGRWIGRGDKNAADGAAVDAMRLMIDSVSMDGVVVIGEGEKDEAPMLFNGEEVGNGEGPGVDVAVDPIDGTALTAIGQPNALSVIALAERGTMFFPGAAVYMEKVATGPGGRRRDRHHAPARRRTSAGSRRPRASAPRRSRSTILDRPRHTDIIDAVRDVGARVFLIRDGDVAGAIAAATPGSGDRPALRDRRHARGRDRGRGAEVPRRRDPGTTLPAQRRANGRPWSTTGFDVDAVLTTNDLVTRRRRLLRGHRHHRRDAAARREVLARTAPRRTRW